jgi:ribose transport system substrate-binding protein
MISVSGTSRRGFLAALAMLPACNRSRKRVIGVVPQGQTHLFWQSIHGGAVAASWDTGVDMLWNAPASEGDYSGQLKVVDAMISRRVNAIALAPADRTALVGVVERAVSNGIPVVVFDTDVDTQVFSARVATDNYGAGAMAAERMASILGGKGEIVIVAVRPGLASTMARESGFEETVRKHPGIRVLDKRYGMADFAQSLQVAENMLTAYPDLAGMFASNESSTVGAVRAIRARSSKCKLVGFDWSPTLAEGLQTGVIDSLVVQDPFRMGYEAVKAAVQKLNGGTPEKFQDLPPLLVTKENFNDPGVQKQLNPDLKKYLGPSRATGIG